MERIAESESDRENRNIYETLLYDGGSEKKLKEKYFFIMEKNDFEKKIIGRKNIFSVKCFFIIHHHHPSIFFDRFSSIIKKMTNRKKFGPKIFWVIFLDYIFLIEIFCHPSFLTSVFPQKHEKTGFSLVRGRQSDQNYMFSHVAA